MIDLGCFSSCDCVDFNIVSDVDGEYKFITSFAGQKVTIVQQALAGDNLQFNSSALNENYNYSARILPPDGSGLDSSIWYQFKIIPNLAEKDAITCVIEGGGGTIIRVVAGENISGFYAVMLRNGLAYTYNPTSILNLNRFAGISTNSAVQGDEVRIAVDGFVNTAYNFTEGSDIFVNPNGSLSETQSINLSHIVAKSFTANSILIKNFNPIILS